MTENQMKEWIDKATYEQLLAKNRFAPLGDLMMVGEIGNYFVETLRKKREEVGQSEHVRASKSVGWD